MLSLNRSAAACSPGIFVLKQRRTSLSALPSASPSVKFKNHSFSLACVTKHPASQAEVTELVFQPFAELEEHILKLQTSSLTSSSQSLARHHYSPACEDSINHQIAFEYHLSYAYHAVFAHFDRDNVALPGFAKFFEGLSLKHRARAELLMKYQNTRGSKVELQKIMGPLHTNFEDEQRGDALHAMEYTLALTRNTNGSLLQVQEVANKEGDPQLRDFLENEFLKPQVEYVKKISEYVSLLRRLGEGHGVYHFDLVLQGKFQGEF